MEKAAELRLAWEHKLVLLLPQSLYMGAIYVGAFFCICYAGFQWFFDFPVESSAFGIIVFLIAVVVLPAYFFDQRNQQDGQTGHRSFLIPLEVVRASRIAGVVGCLISLALWELIQVSQGNGFLSHWADLYAGTAIIAMFVLLGWLTGRGAFFSYRGVWDKPFPEISTINLLDLENIYHMGRKGLGGALIWFIVVAFAGLLILPTVNTGLWLVIIIFVINAGIGLMFLLVPAQKVRNLIRRAKLEEMTRLDPMLIQARDDALAHTSSTTGRLSDLFVYKNQIQAIPEWPFNYSTLVRFSLYLLIPIFSMVGGALVERLIELVLD